MGKIKSAWEIALEKTEHITIDPEKIRHDEWIKKGRQLAGSYLNNIDRTIEEATTDYEACTQEEKPAVTEGIRIAVMQNITLPVDDYYHDRFVKTRNLAELISVEKSQVAAVFDQLQNLFSEYIQMQDMLLQRLKEQYQPILEQKQAQYRQQYGQNITLQPEQDPEFIKLLQQHYKQMESQYQQAMEEAKQQLSALL